MGAKSENMDPIPDRAEGKEENSQLLYRQWYSSKRPKAL